jgi:hypothetical protein
MLEEAEVNHMIGGGTIYHITLRVVCLTALICPKFAAMLYGILRRSLTVHAVYFICEVED